MKINTANTVSAPETVDTDYSVVNDESEHMRKMESYFNKSNSEQIIENEPVEHVDIENTPEKEESSNKQRVNFLNESFSNSFFKRKTEESKSEPVDETIKSEINSEDYYKEAFSKSSEEVLDKEDFEDVAAVLIEALDTGMSYICAAIAKDLDKPEKYEIQDKKKRKLSDQLSRIFQKRQVKLTIEMVFAMSLVLIYSGPVKDAIKARGLKSETNDNTNTVENESKPASKSTGTGRPKRSA